MKQNTRTGTVRRLRPLAQSQTARLLLHGRRSSHAVELYDVHKVWESGCGAMFTPDENEVPNHNERTDLVGSVG